MQDWKGEEQFECSSLQTAAVAVALACLLQVGVRYLELISQVVCWSTNSRFLWNDDCLLIECKYRVDQQLVVCVVIIIFLKCVNQFAQFLAYSSAIMSQTYLHLVGGLA